MVQIVHKSRDSPEVSVTAVAPAAAEHVLIASGRVLNTPRPVPAVFLAKKQKNFMTYGSKNKNKVFGNLEKSRADQVIATYLVTVTTVNCLTTENIAQNFFRHL